MSARSNDLNLPAPGAPRPAVPGGPYLVLGLGRAGRSAATALAGLGGDDVAAVEATDSPATRRAARSLRALGVETRLGDDGADALDVFGPIGCVVKSPGIPFAHPILDTAAERGIPVIDELELAWRLRSGPVIAVTGTNGKSTTCSLIAHVLAAQGIHVVLAGNTEFGPALSAPSAREAGVVVCEVSSNQLEGSPAFRPDIAVLTNLTRDHFGRHGGPEGYHAAKRRMFLREDGVAAISVLNVGEPFARAIARELEDRGGRVVRFGDHPACDHRLGELGWDLAGGTGALSTPAGPLILRTRLPGRHNALNLAAAAAVAAELGIPIPAIESALGSAEPVPGRLEPVDAGQPFDVFVDYAHNADGIRQTLETVRHAVAGRPAARVHAVVSALARSDPGKRSEMGAVAAELADRVVLTTELLDPVPPEGQLDGLTRGAAEGAADVVAIADRGDAIARALAAAAPGDVVVIMGRGAATGPVIAPDGAVSDFDDRSVARRSLLRLGAAAG